MYRDVQEDQRCAAQVWGVAEEFEMKAGTTGWGEVPCGHVMLALAHALGAGVR